MASQQKAIAKRNLAIAQAAAAKAAAAAKVAQIRALYGQLWYRHANWLAQQDLNAKKKLLPRARYENLAKAWSKQIIAKGKLPTSSLGATSGADMSVAMFQNMIQAILASAQGQLLANPPVDPNLDPNSLTSYTPVYPYQTNPATALATSITTALAPDGSTPDGSTPSPDGSDTDSSGSLNDDELAVARDGGHSERAALARIRGTTQVGVSPYLHVGPSLVFRDVDSVPPRLYGHVSSTKDLTHPRRASRIRVLPYSYVPNPGNRRLTLQDGSRESSQFIRCKARMSIDIIRGTTKNISGNLNDDELAVARDGGSSELASLARVRGCTMTMGLSPSQMAAQQKAIARRNLAIKQSIAKANAARAAVLARTRLPPPPAPPPIDPNLDPDSPTSYTPIYPYQTNPATDLATSITSGKGSPSRQLAAAHASYAVASRRQQPAQAAPDGTDDASPQSSSSSSKSSKPDPDGDDDQDAPDKPSKSREPNDDEQEVAMDGGACERAALARIRGRY